MKRGSAAASARTCACSAMMRRLEAPDKRPFARALPSLTGALVPVKWLWRWSRRRFGSAGDGEAMATLLTEGITYGEAPRFRPCEGKLYYVDSYANAVRRFDPVTRQDELVATHDDYVSGLGWLPDGRLLVVSMKKQQVLVLDDATQTFHVYADLRGVVRDAANDMVVSSSGQVYVGNCGFDFINSMSMYTTTLVRVSNDRSVHVEATGMFFPNGSVITPDGKTLLVAETYGAKITAFDVMQDGSLANKRVWANLKCPVDGMCLDAEGCVWVAVPQIGLYKTAGALLRVRKGGELLSTLGFGANGITRSVFACQLATDADGSHYLYFLEANTSNDNVIFKHGADDAKKNGVLKRIQVAVGPATMTSNSNYCGGYC